jgi:hypothetical protein
VCARRRADLLILVAGLVPAPGEAAQDWWANTGYQDEPRERFDDEIELFYHDVPPQLAAEAVRRGRAQSDTPTRQPWPLHGWPHVPTRFVLCRGDRCCRPGSCAGWCGNAVASRRMRSTRGTASR